MKTFKWFISLAALMTAVGAHGASHRVSYASYAGDPVTSFRYVHLYNFQSRDGKSVAIWTRPSEAFLVDVAGSCEPVDSRLVFFVGGVERDGGTVRVGEDVIMGSHVCHVHGIRPLDLERMKRS